MNCPHLPPDDPRSHSLLLERGLIRVALPWPPQTSRRHAASIRSSRIEVVRDPGGCNTHRTYGLESANPTISVYRRPRPVANTKYTTHQNFGVGPFIAKSGLPTATDPATGRPTSMNLMSDARAPTLAVQAQDAAAQHLQLKGAAHRRAACAHRRIRAAGLCRRRCRAPLPAAWLRPTARRRSVRDSLPPAMRACSATTRRATCFRWPDNGTGCHAPALNRRTRATRHANRSRAGTTCSCSGRSGSATRCT